MQVNIAQAESMTVTYLKAGLVPFMVGSPGMGKSAIIHKIAKDFNLKVIDLRLSQCDPTDLNGFPKLSGERGTYAAMDTFPLEGDSIPEGFSGWLLFLDELNGADVSVQKASYKLVLDRMAGMKHLHKKVLIVAAGNETTDNALVEPMSTALQSRLAHIELSMDVKQWLDWAAENDINHHITGYINFKPGNLHAFDPDHTDKTFACPRTWFFANNVLNTADPDDPNMLPLLAGVISEGVAREFLSFRKLFKDLPKISDVVISPDTVSVPTEPSIVWAMCGSIAHNATDKNLTPLIRYLGRLPPEFQVVCLREVGKRNRTLMKHPAMASWYAKTSIEVF